VYTGSCRHLACTLGDLDTECRFSKSHVTWIGQEGVEYFIHIYGKEHRGYFETGLFDLEVQEEALPFSDSCDAAIGPLPTNVFEYFSTTRTAATVDGFPNKCGFEITLAGVWFTVLGTGDRLSASTCNKYTFFEARVSIFQSRNNGIVGPSAQCDDLECIDESEGAFYTLCDGSQGSLVSWKSTDRQKYYVLVHGNESENGAFGLAMDFQVSNDFCEDAVLVPVGQTVISGSTISGTVDQVGSCGEAVNSAAGVWYAVEGTGLSITANICYEATDRDLHLSVFEGSCGDLECVSGSSQEDCADDFELCEALTWPPQAGMRLSWNAVAGSTYYIAIRGDSRDAGNVELSLTAS
jgi:hypothetical protein